MRAISGAVLRCVLSSIAVSAVFSLPTSADAKTRRVEVARVGSPPGGGEALYVWCRHAVFQKYGMRGAEALAQGNGLKPGQKALVMLDSTVEPMISYCMQQGGKNY